MKDHEEFYILGLPVETDIGTANFIKVKDYPYLSDELYVVSWDKYTISYQLEKLIDKDDPLQMEFIDEIRKPEYTLFDIVVNIPDIQYAYQKVFSFVFDDKNILLKLNKDNFHYYRRLVLRMNGTKEKKSSPNPEIQEWNEESEKIKRDESNPLTFADIASSIVGYNGLSYENLNEMTLYQFYYTFHRISHIKGYDTTSLFATVSPDVKIEEWCKHINLFEEEKHGISRNEFMKKTDFSVY